MSELEFELLLPLAGGLPEPGFGPPPGLLPPLIGNPAAAQALDNSFGSD
jgi:hypothetical protein